MQHCGQVLSVCQLKGTLEVRGSSNRLANSVAGGVCASEHPSHVATETESRGHGSRKFFARNHEQARTSQKMIFGAAQVPAEVAGGNLAHIGKTQNLATALAYSQIRYLSRQRARRWQVAPTKVTDKLANHL